MNRFLPVLALLLAGCQQIEPRIECARLEADTLAVINRHPRPPFDLDPVESRDFYLLKGNIDFPLLEVANPYAKALHTRDPYTFCKALTGRNALGEVSNPYR